MKTRAVTDIIGLAALASVLYWCATGNGWWATFQVDKYGLMEFRGYVVFLLHAAGLAAGLFGRLP